MRKLVGLSVLAVMAVACVDELAEGAGEMLVDAGQVLADAGAALADAGDDSAQALTDAGQLVKPADPSTVEIACDKRYERTTQRFFTSLPGQEVEEPVKEVRWYGSLAVDTVGITGVDVLLCDVEHTGQVPCDGKPGKDWTYVCEGSMPAEPRCVTAQAELGDGYVRARCGDADSHYKTIRLTIRH